MRILNVMLTKEKGGDGLMARNYHEALVSEGFEVLSVGAPQGMLDGVSSGHGFRPLQHRFQHDPLAALNLGGMTASFKPDVIIAHGNRAGRLCMMPLTGTRRRLVQVLHTPSFKRHLKEVPAAVAVSRRIHQGAAEKFPQLPLFDVENFSNLKPMAVKDAPSKPPVIGGLGRLHAIKGFDILLHAVARLRDAGLDFRLKLGGEGPAQAELQALTVALGLQDRVEFSGWISDPMEFLAGIDLFVVPSREESFGLVVIEAMAAGVPVIASDTEGPCEVLKDGTLGTLFAREDTEALADSIRNAFDDWSDHAGRARDAQDHVMAEFSFDAGRRRLRHLVESFTPATGRA